MAPSIICQPRSGYTYAWRSVGVARQRVVELGAVGGVQAPGAHAPRRELCRRSTPVLAEAGLQVGDVERHRIAQRIGARAGRGKLRVGRNAGKQLVAAENPRARRIRAGAVYARRPEAAALRIDEPPALADLLHAEKPRRLAFARGKAAIATGRGTAARHEHALFGAPFAHQFLRVACLARPVGMHVLAVVVDDGSAAVEHRISCIGLREADLANFDGGAAHRIPHGEADGAHALDGAMPAGLDVDPVAVARLVHGGRQFVGVAQALAIETQRDRGPHPDIGERMNALGYAAGFTHQAQLESLAAGGAELDHQEFVILPVLGETRIQIRERPLHGGNFAREDRLLRRCLSANNHPGQRECGQPRAPILHLHPFRERAQFMWKVPSGKHGWKTSSE